jgi:hypothetical protein
MFTRRAICAGLLGVFVGAVQAQASAPQAGSYPTQPIRMVLPLSAGTTTDLVARAFAARLGQRLGQTVIVENRPGAGGTLAAQVVAKAPADGYTILLVNSQHAINPFPRPSLPYDTLRDFAGLAMVAEAPSRITVPRELGSTPSASSSRWPRKAGLLGSSGRRQPDAPGRRLLRRQGRHPAHARALPHGGRCQRPADQPHPVGLVPAPFVMGQINEGKPEGPGRDGHRARPCCAMCRPSPRARSRATSSRPGSASWPASRRQPLSLPWLVKTIQAIAEDPAAKQKLTEQA